MSAIRSGLCAFAVGALAVAGQVHGQAAEAGAASPWTELANARARLVGGPPAEKGKASYLAGVEVTLGDGWKTYWRMPGDAGVPPSFDWAGSRNVASLKVLYPAPARLSEPAAETVGYKKSVLFPVEVVPKDASRPVDLALDVEFGVCREICIPAEAKLKLTLAPSSLSGEPSPALRAALDKVPRQQASRRALDPRLKAATATLEGEAPHLTIEANFPRAPQSADLFIEGPDGLYVPMARRLPEAVGGAAPLTADAAEGLVRFRVDLKAVGDVHDLKGKTLVLTLVSDAGATETTWTVP